MKHPKSSVKRILLALLFVSACAGAARAGDRDMRVISARAGGVNFVSGDVRVRRADSPEWRALSSSDELKSGDSVATGADGRVEILLNPGSYFRAGAGAEFTLAVASLDGLRLELARGGAVVEATGYEQLDLDIEVATARAVVHIVRTGIYRINALPGGEAEVAVFEGRALVGGLTVKGGTSARTGAAGVEVSKFDKKNRDGLDLWSRDRGKELAKANENLTRRALRTAFGSNSAEELFGPFGRTLGFWFYNSRARCYTFIPYSAYWRSPYGYWYGTGVIYNPGSTWNGQHGYTPPNTTGGVITTGGGLSGSGPGAGGSGVGGAAPSQPVPRDVPVERAPPTSHGERPPGPRQRDNR